MFLIENFRLHFNTHLVFVSKNRNFYIKIKILYTKKYKFMSLKITFKDFFNQFLYKIYYYFLFFKNKKQEVYQTV